MPFWMTPKAVAESIWTVAVAQLEGQPPRGMAFGVVGTIAPLVDLWVEERRLPDHMRVAPKAGG